MKKKVLVTARLLSAEHEELEKNFDLVTLWKERDPDQVIRDNSQDIVGIATGMTKVSRTLIEALPNLEIIATNSVGTDHIDLGAARERGIAVTNTPDVLTDDTADTALSLLLAVTRRVCEADMYVRVGKWTGGDMPLGTALKGKKTGIVGLGRIGSAIARRCEAFGMDILYHGRSKKDVPYAYYPDVKAMARDSDFLILACPGGEKTAGMIDSSVLDALGPKGFLINIARGSVVDETALVEALQERRIAGAGLDVYAREPHVPEPLISMDNVVLLPHIGSATFETRTIMGKLVVANLIAHFQGNALLTPVQ